MEHFSGPGLATLVIGGGERLLLASAGAESLFGYPWEELRQRPASDLLEPWPPPREAADWSDAGIDVVPCLSVVRRDGMRTPVRAILSRVECEYGPAIMLTLQRDGSPGHDCPTAALEAAIFQAQRLASFGQLARAVAHDLNNYLSVILNYTSFVADGLPRQDPLREDVEEIRRAAERAAGLTQQLLTFGRPHRASSARADLNQVISETARLLQRAISERYRLFLSLDPTVGEVRMDEGHLEQVLVNLVLNARDAMPDGGTIAIETDAVELWSGPSYPSLIPGRYAYLRVRDTGCGMTPEVRARAFEPFFTTKAHGVGSGLGLSIVHSLVRQAGGRVWLDSRPGEGTTVTVCLPACR